MVNRNLLLISNSTNAGEEYLAWPKPYIHDFIKEHQIKTVLFVPYAGVNLTSESVEKSFDHYTQRVSNFFSGLDVTLKSVHCETDRVGAVKNSEAIVAGGGNTFHQIKMMYETIQMNYPAASSGVS